MVIDQWPPRRTCMSIVICPLRRGLQSVANVLLKIYFEKYNLKNIGNTIYKIGEMWLTNDHPVVALACPMSVEMRIAKCSKCVANNITRVLVLQVLRA